MHEILTLIPKLEPCRNPLEAPECEPHGRFKDPEERERFEKEEEEAKKKADF